MDVITVEDAIREYPELARLFLLTHTGAAWQVTHFRQAGEVKGLMWRRLWPNRTLDELGIRDQTNARSVRKDPQGVRIWEELGTVGDVVDKMLEQLLPPDAPLAPHLGLPRVAAGAFRRDARLWVP